MAGNGIITPSLAIRSNTGVEVWKSNGFKEPYVPDKDFARDESKICRAIVYSPNGRFLAWANGSKVQICTASNWSVICTLPRPKAFYIKFSPKSTYLMTWEVYTENPKETPAAKPNLFLYKAETGEEVFSIIQKRQTDWELHWSSDESLFALMIGGEVLFYEVNGENGFTKPAKRLGGGRNGGVSLSPGASPPYVAFYVPGVKGAPSMCKLYKYPNLDANQPVASKSFFQADKVDMIWNRKGNGLLLLTSTDVDQTGVSYYGKQALHYMTVKGDSFAVQLSADGPIHAVTWSPKSTEFCVVYGFMPSKATLFNLKCDSVFDFGTGNRNSVYYNDFGNLVLFGGFGNLPGHIEMWDMQKKTQISQYKAPDTTLLEWSPTGDIYVTATTAPRLRMSNGFKVWHYSGALLHETNWPDKQELLEVVWQKYPPGTIKENVITAEKVQGIASSTPEASKQKYVPPGARNSLGEASIRPLIPGLPPGYRPTTAKPKKKFNQRKVETPEVNGAVTETTPKSAAVNNATRRASVAPDPEKEKKIKSLHKKVKEIKVLKKKVENGEKMEANQTAKINSEAELVKELKALRAS